MPQATYKKGQKNITFYYNLKSIKDISFKIEEWHSKKKLEKRQDRYEKENLCNKATIYKKLILLYLTV